MSLSDTNHKISSAAAQAHQVLLLILANFLSIYNPLTVSLSPAQS